MTNKHSNKIPINWEGLSRISDDSSHRDHPDHIDIDDRAGLIEDRSGLDMIERHRKIYVSDRDDQFEPVIHPIEVTIPVKVRQDPVDGLPPPKPVFRMHKYTTIETKPEVQMVPVTTTIIKPVGVSKDQIIEDES